MHARLRLKLSELKRCNAPVLLAALTLASPLLNAQPNNDVQPTPTAVYRVDPRPPEEVFANGFSTNGQLQSFLAHALGSSCDAITPRYRSAWVSTSTSRVHTLRVATQQLQDRSIPQPALNGSSGIWLYVITPDVSYLHVLFVMTEAAVNGEANQGGYTPRQAELLHQLMSPPSTIFYDAEVVTHRVPPSSIRSATLVSLNPVDDPSHPLIMQGPIRQNPGYQAPTTVMNNVVNNLTELVPPESIALYAQPAIESCFLACDGASGASNHSHRHRRSVIGDLSCRHPKSVAQALISSDD